MDNTQETIQFLRAFLKCLIHSDTSNQVFLYLLGTGGTGKPVFIRICTAMVGHENTVNTSLSAMNNDAFEVTNFKDKKMVTINDTGEFKDSLSRLK